MTVTVSQCLHQSEESVMIEVISETFRLADEPCYHLLTLIYQFIELVLKH